MFPCGDIIFYTYPGATVPHHVVIYLGGDRIFEAPRTGENVRYGALSEFTGRDHRRPSDHRTITGCFGVVGWRT